MVMTVQRKIKQIRGTDDTRDGEGAGGNIFKKVTREDDI